MLQIAFVYRFGAFTLDPANRRLMAGNQYVHLTETQFSILLYLVSHAPEIWALYGPGRGTPSR